MASLADMQTQVQSRAASIATRLGVALPEATRVGPTPCENPSGDLSKDGRYSITGNWQIPLPKSKQRTTFQQVRSDWLATDYKIISYKELPDGVRATYPPRIRRRASSFSLAAPSHLRRSP
jgi:hypothetical protein